MEIKRGDATWVKDCWGALKGKTPSRFGGRGRKFPFERRDVLKRRELKRGQEDGNDAAEKSLFTVGRKRAQLLR